MNCSVYMHECTVNGKRYIGWTSKSIEVRWVLHVRSSRVAKPRYPFARAIREHGTDAWHHVLLETFDTPSEARSAEVKWIAALETNMVKGGWGYNLTDGGEGITGYRHTNETKQAMSCAKKGRRLSPATRLKVSAGLKLAYERDPLMAARVSESSRGRRHSAETKKKMSKVQRANPSMKGRTGALHPTFGRTHTDAARHAISCAKKGIKHSEETRQRMSVAHAVPVFRCDLEGNVVQRYENVSDVAVDGFSPQQAARAARGQTKGGVHRGFIWRRIKNEIHQKTA